jgi:SAM-dependent methyltransferase
LKIPNDISVRNYVYSLVDWSTVNSVLDVGCGNGHDLRHIASYTGSQARLTGLDKSEVAIASAKAAESSGSPVEFHDVDIAAGIPFDNSTFDVVYSYNFIESVVDKQEHLREIRRVLRPGGTIVCAHYDWDSVAIDGRDKDIVRRIIHAFGDWKQAWMTDCDAWIGRRLRRIFDGSGQFHGSVHTRVLTETNFAQNTYGFELINSFRALVRRGDIKEDEFQLFYKDLEQLASKGEYFFSITMYVYVGKAGDGEFEVRSVADVRKGLLSSMPDVPGVPGDAARHPEKYMQDSGETTCRIIRKPTV